MLDEKDVQNMLKKRGFSADSQRIPLCKSLRITCGEVADKARKYDETDSSGQMMQVILNRILTLDFVFSLPTTTTSCGAPLTSPESKRTL